jgi:hypothetical protein
VTGEQTLRDGKFSKIAIATPCGGASAHIRFIQNDKRASGAGAPRALAASWAAAAPAGRDNRARVPACRTWAWIRGPWALHGARPRMSEGASLTADTSRQGRSNQGRCGRKEVSIVTSLDADGARCRRRPSRGTASRSYWVCPTGKACGFGGGAILAQSRRARRSALRLRARMSRLPRAPPGPLTRLLTCFTSSLSELPCHSSAQRMQPLGGSVQRFLWRASRMHVPRRSHSSWRRRAAESTG